MGTRQRTQPPARAGLDFMLRSWVVMLRSCAAAGVTLLALVLSAPTTAAEPRIAVLELEMMKSDLLPGGAWPTPDEAARMRRVADLLRTSLAEAGYDVVSGADTRAAAQAHASTEYLHLCNGCERDIAMKVNADWVMVGWAQIVSYLIQNLNVVVTRVDDGHVLARGFVDLRGNTDDAFFRATHYLLDNILLERLLAHR